jgi:hypothetical protein
MSLARFLEVLFKRGQVVFRKKPLFKRIDQPDPEALRVLESEYRRYALDLPGKAPALNAEVAYRAAVLLHDACWFLLSREEEDDEVLRRINWEGTASTPTQHFSSDLCLCFAKRVHRRAKALNPEDVLVKALEGVLRRRPLSGVLCDIDEPPAALEFGEHEGLLLLYAERLAAHPKPGWMPEGRAREYLELVQTRRRGSV